MDPFRLLSRSTKLSKNSHARPNNRVPSNGQATTNLAPVADSSYETHCVSSIRRRKRRRLSGEHVDAGSDDAQPYAPEIWPEQFRVAPMDQDKSRHISNKENHNQADIHESTLEERKGLLRKHKLKVTWLNPFIVTQSSKRISKTGDKWVQQKLEKETLFPDSLDSFGTLKNRYHISDRVASNVEEEGYTSLTEVQLVALPLMLDRDLTYLHRQSTKQSKPQVFDGIDLLTVAPTGSGKTLAFLIPLIHRIAETNRGNATKTRSISAIILAPTKELVGQIVNEGRKLVAGTGVRISQARKGMHIRPDVKTQADSDDEANRNVSTGDVPVVKSDILVSTPGTLDGIIRAELEYSSQPLSSVCYLVLDEADVLLDPLFREQTLKVWNTLNQPNLRVSLWSATMGSNIEELARAQIKEYRTRVSKLDGNDHTEAPLIRLVVGLKDSAVPNVQHRLIYAASEQGKLMSLRQILHPTSSSVDAGPALVPPFLIFTQTIARAIALHSELLYDIPVEAGGISRIAVLHSDLSDSARDRVMTRFRRAEIWVLITTDLLSRGIDFRGVNGVINYDIPTSSAAYVHRVGRTGRAGREGGVAITLYAKEDIQYLKNIANVVAAAQKLPGAVNTGEGVQPWLLDSLPSLSKKTKQELKRRGVESRTARGKVKDPKAARRARISTKAGFVRREDNRKKGAIAGAQKRKLDEDDVAENASESDFDGFD